MFAQVQAKTHAKMVVLGLALLVAGACGGRVPGSEESLKKGNEYAAAKKYDEAIIEYRRALQEAPTLAEAHYRLGDAYAAQSNVVAALGAYIRAADLNPALLDAQIKASQLLILARRYDDARVRLRTVLEKEPQNTTALIMLGNALVGLRSFDEAAAATERAIALDPKRAGAYINLGAVRYIQGDKSQSEAAYLAAINANPTELEARLGLADFYWLEKRVEASERAYLDALALDPSSLRANRAVADFYIKAGRGAAAEPYLKKVAETAKQAVDWYALADYYTAMHRHRDALALLLKLRKQKPMFAEATVRIALLARLDSRPAEANRFLDEVIKSDPTNARALALKAHILLDSRQRQQAFEVAKRAVASDARSDSANLVLGIAALASGQTEIAKKAFLEVLKLNPTSTEAMIELAQLFLDQHLVDTALQYAEQAVKAGPDLVEARLMRLRVLANHSERAADARREMAVLLNQYPLSAAVQYEAGLAAVVRKDNAGAYRYFQRARDLEGSFLLPLIELVKLDILTHNLPSAKRRIDDALTKLPESIDLLLIAGTAYALIDPAVGEKHLRRVIELDPSNIAAYESLAGMFLTRNRIDKAREEFINLAKQQPMDISPPTMVGIISEAQGNKVEAEKWYLAALKIDSRAAAAANNLAWMYAEDGRNLETAVELAQVARAELPRQPEVTDTLGWAYLKKGLIAQAVRAFQDAVEQAPQNALYRYHLGLAYAQSGEDARARISIQEALKLDPKFPHLVEAQRALGRLLY